MLAAAAALCPLALRGAGLRPHGRARGSLGQAVKAGLHRIFRHRPLAVMTVSSTFTQLGQGGLAIAAVALSIERAGSAIEGAALVTLAIGSGLSGVFTASTNAAMLYLRNLHSSAHLKSQIFTFSGGFRVSASAGGAALAGAAAGWGGGATWQRSASSGFCPRR